MRTLLGSRCSNNCQNKDSSMEFVPRRCCILQSNWVGCRSPSSSVVRSWSRRRCSEDCVRVISRAFNASYGASVGGETIMSRISEMNSGAREATICWNFTFWLATHLVAKTASTCANHASGSAGQYGGSFTLRPTGASSASARPAVASRAGSGDCCGVSCSRSKWACKASCLSSNACSWVSRVLETDRPRPTPVEVGG